MALPGLLKKRLEKRYDHALLRMTAHRTIQDPKNVILTVPKDL
jgi:hypothetical protein